MPLIGRRGTVVLCKEATVLHIMQKVKQNRSGAALEKDH